MGVASGPVDLPRDLRRQSVLWIDEGLAAMADLVTRDAVSDAFDALDHLNAELVRLRGLAGDLGAIFEPFSPSVASLIQAWAAARQAFDSAESTAACLTAVTRVREALEAVLKESRAPTPDTRAFADATLSADDLHSDLADLAGALDWDEVQRELGVELPGSVRNAPFEIATGADAFNGRSGLSVRTTPWAPGAVREGLDRLMDQHLLPAVARKRGGSALGRASEAPVADAHACRILFGTNRVVDRGVFTTASAAGPDALTFGEARVSVPNKLRRGSVPRPWRVLGVGLPENADQHIVLLGAPTVLARGDFLRALAANTGAGAAFLFVHGFNTPFEAGFWRTAQLATDLEIEGPVLHYAWPSAGKPSRYDYDADSLDASVTPFKAFVRTLIEDAGLKALNVVAHSKGCQLVLDAFAELAQEAGGERRAAHLVLASPDVAENVAADRLLRVPAYFASVTLYANAHDRPLVVSEGKAKRPRVGGLMRDGAPFIAAGMDSIDAGETDAEWFAFNHDAYVDAPVLMYDLEALLKRGVRPPDMRSPVIRPQTCERGPYFKVVTE
ncbi:MAG: hypothetical protein JWR35_3722 [Marmoricola sp.]|nr:hypothetical protein [Marmoricola sp.]